MSRSKKRSCRIVGCLTCKPHKMHRNGKGRFRAAETALRVALNAEAVACEPMLDDAVLLLRDAHGFYYEIGEPPCDCAECREVAPTVDVRFDALAEALRRAA